MQDVSADKKQAVQAVIFSEDRQSVLLLKRRDIPVWVVPGGGLDPGETPEKGILREIEEETGCRAVVVRKVAEYLPVNRMTQLTHLFECHLVTSTLHPTEEASEVRFFHLDDLPPMPPPYPIWIKDAEIGYPDLLRKKISGVNYWVLFKLFILHPILVGKYILKLIKNKN